MWQLIRQYVLYFVIGGTVTSVIVGFEEHGSRNVSVIAALVPVFTLVAYFLIGESKGGVAVGQHSWLVLIGTLVSWVPYMIVVALLAPKIGSRKAIGLGLATFFVLAVAYVAVVERYGYFKAR